MTFCAREKEDFPSSEFKPRRWEGTRYVVHLTPQEHTTTDIDWPPPEEPPMPFDHEDDVE